MVLEKCVLNIFFCLSTVYTVYITYKSLTLIDLTQIALAEKSYDECFVYRM